MNYLQNAALLVGVAAIAMAPVAAQAQTCANPSQTPLTKARLDQITTSQGIPLSQVGVRFQRFALNTIRQGNPVPPNNRHFESPLRQSKPPYIANVEPDGVVPSTACSFCNSFS